MPQLKALIYNCSSREKPIEKMADKLLFIPRLFIGRTVKVITREGKIAIGKKFGEDGTRESYRIEKKKSSNGSLLIKFGGNFDSVGIGLFILGSVGAVASLTLIALKTAIVGSLSLVTICTTSTLFGLALKKICIETNRQSKVHFLAIDQFLEMEKTYKAEKKLIKAQKLTSQELVLLQKELKEGKAKLEAVQQIMLRESQLWLRARKLESHHLKAEVERIERQRAKLLTKIQSQEKEIESLVLHHAKTSHSLKELLQEYSQLIDSGQTQRIDLSEIRSGLHMALQTKNLKLIAQLVEDKRTDLHEPDKEGNTPLHEAVKMGHPEIIRLLVTHGSSVQQRNHEGKTPLELAIERQNLSALEILLQQPNIPLFDQNETPLLFLAIKGESEKILEHLLKYSKEHIESKNDLGMTPLLYATLLGKTTLVRKLLEYRADPQAMTSKEENSILHIAAISRNETLLSLIIEFLEKKNHFNAEIQNQDGRTPLHLAVRTGHLPIIKKLLEHKANPLATDKFGKKPLDYRPNSTHSLENNKKIINLLK